MASSVSDCSLRWRVVILRVEHTSNASIKKPNPGENFVQLRYGYTF